MAKEKTEKPKKEITKVEEHSCTDIDCHVHGSLKARGRSFEGTVVSKFHKRVAIEFERMVYMKKYERYSKSKTKIHVRLPVCMENQIHLGDVIKVQECRPLSKIIHFVVVKKIKSAEEAK
jgi:small subunit ribosomal protein S17